MAAPDMSGVLAAVDFSAVVAAVVAIGAICMVPLVAGWGVRRVLAMVDGDDLGSDADQIHDTDESLAYGADGIGTRGRTEGGRPADTANWTEDDWNSAEDEYLRGPDY